MTVSCPWSVVLVTYANYRATGRARSKTEFIAKMGVVVEEADETVFWLELLVEADIVPETKLRDLLKEANEVLAIFAASQRTAKAASSMARWADDPILRLHVSLSNPYRWFPRALNSRAATTR